MKVNIYDRPPALVFGRDEEKFSLNLKRWTGIDRAAVLDAAGTNSLAAIQAAIRDVVIGWAGVNKADGSPLNYETADSQGRPTGNVFDEFMGAVSFDLQVEILAAVAAAMNLPGMAEALAKVAGKTVDASPTLPPAGSTQTTVSGG